MSTPTLPLNAGFDIPQIGFGTWPFLAAEAEVAVGQALAAGYRLIDTAARYSNETGVGRAIAASDVPRSQILVTSKIRGGDQGYDLTLRAIDASLANLGLDYLDLMLIHWPLPMLGLYVETWQALERAAREGLVRAIGVSNFLPEHLDALAEVSDVVPAVNQIELHPYFQQAEQRADDDARGIRTQAWGPLGRGNAILSDPTIVAIAAQTGYSPAQVVLRWHIQLGVIAIPKSANPDRMAENLAAAQCELTAEQMAAIGALDRGERTVEGPATHDER